MDEKIGKIIGDIKSGIILKLSIFRNSADFLDGKYDEIKVEIGYEENSQTFTVFERKFEIFWDAAGGGGPIYSDEERHKMSETELSKYIQLRLNDKGNYVEIVE